MDGIFSGDLRKAKRRLAFPLPLRGAGYIPENFHTRKGTYASVDFGLRISGRSEFSVVRVNGKRFSLRYPCAIICAPGVLYENMSEAAWECLFFSYESRFAPVLNSMGVGFTELFWELEMTESLSFMTRRMISLMSQVRVHGSADRLDSLAWSILSEAVLSRRAGTVKGRPNEDKIRMIASCLGMSFKEKISFEELAAGHGLSMRTFFRCWGKTFDMSPMAYLEELRMDEAARMLAGSDITVQETAFAVGFDDVFYFSRRFKARRGLSPSDYRAEWRKDGRSQMG